MRLSAINRLTALVITLTHPPEIESFLYNNKYEIFCIYIIHMKINKYKNKICKNEKCVYVYMCVY